MIIDEKNLKEINEFLAEKNIKSLDELKKIIYDPLYHFSKKEAEFRLRERFKIKNPSETLINNVAEIIFDDTELFINYEALDDMISNYLKEVFEDE